MASDRESTHLKAVPSRKRTSGQVDPPSGYQPPLFPDPPTSLLGIVDMSGMSAADFYDLVAVARHSWVFDLRSVPRFDVGSLSRRIAFDLFAQHEIQYHDVAGMPELYAWSRSAFSVKVAAAILSRRLKCGGAEACKIFVLLDNPVTVASSVKLFPAELTPCPAGGWRVEVYGLKGGNGSSEG